MPYAFSIHPIKRQTYVSYGGRKEHLLVVEQKIIVCALGRGIDRLHYLLVSENLTTLLCLKNFRTQDKQSLLGMPIFDEDVSF